MAYYFASRASVWSQALSFLIDPCLLWSEKGHYPGPYVYDRAHDLRRDGIVLQLARQLDGGDDGGEVIGAVWTNFTGITGQGGSADGKDWNIAIAEMEGGRARSIMVFGSVRLLYYPQLLVHGRRSTIIYLVCIWSSRLARNSYRCLLLSLLLLKSILTPTPSLTMTR